jgi:hypothetical protein
MSKQKALQRLSEVVSKVTELTNEHERLEAERRKAIEKADEPFSLEQQQLSAAQDYIRKQYDKQRKELDEQFVKLNTKREKERSVVRKPFDREIRKTTNEIDRLMNEARDIADDNEVVVHFDDGTIYDPSTGLTEFNDSWESSSC